jgi:hypothetical protein
MALRAHDGPTPSTKSTTIGGRVEFTAKVENSGQADESVFLSVEELKEGALGKPVAFAFSFDPPAVGLRAKSRSRIGFSWTAALPPEKPAFTFRGKLVLRRTTDGALIATAPLDLYVSEA